MFHLYLRKILSSAAIAISSAKLWITGQTVSYRTGDDGGRKEGRGVDFTTLEEDNPLGNTDRITDLLGGQTYADNIYLDWSTYNGSEVLGFYYTGVSFGTVIWNTAIDNALAHSVGSFTSDWYLPNIRQVINLTDFGILKGMNYPPFNLNASGSFWTSTTSPRNTGTAFHAVFGAQYSVGFEYNKTSTRPVYLYAREFTNAELGI